MLSRITVIFFIVLSVTLPLLFTGCAGTTHTETLSKDDISDTLKELYDADTLLKKADRFFKEKDYLSAIQEYRRFLELHPINKSAPYVQYRMGLSYFKQIRSVDRDIEPVQKALSAFEILVKVYPGSEYVNDSKEKIKICRGKLAEREFYIGNFYLRKEDYQAAIVRFNNILTDYKDTDVVEKTTYHLGVAYSSSGKADKAIEVLQNLIAGYPGSRYKKGASQLLAKLNGH